MQSLAILLFAAIIGSTCAFSVNPSAVEVPSWTDLQSNSALNKPPRPIYNDKLPEDINSSNGVPILYRDKDCIDGASETVWLGMECKNIQYSTVLVSKDDDDAIPRIVWPDDDGDGHELETDPIKLLEQIQSRYPDTPPNFYPKLSSAVDASRCNIMRQPGVMPRYSEPQYMSHAPYIFKEDGTLVKQSSHAVSLEEVEEMQEEYYLGSYLCGRDVTAADMGKQTDVNYL